VARKSPELSRIKFLPLTADRWTDLQALFGDRGACGGCWCMAWRLRNKDWTAGKGDRNKRSFRRIVKAGKEPGLLAYLGNAPIAWCAVAPREEYLSLMYSRVLKPIDDKPVWSISCLFVQKEYRRRGVSARILRAAVEFAGKRGARIVEGYPVQPTMETTPDPFIWTGIPSAFRRAGFREVARRSRTRPIMRRSTRRRVIPAGPEAGA
jgi:GNAT superfamily N-acetyltransferase